MSILDQPKQIARLDQQNMMGSILALRSQCLEALRAARKLRIPRNYKAVKNICLSGMGGSALGGHIIQSLFFDSLKVPLHIVNGYHLPAWVNRDTLCIISSYSGTTEETLSAYSEARRQGAKIVGITTGGQLAEVFIKHQAPFYLVKEKSNPCGQPRMGLGYSVFGQIGILEKIGFLKIDRRELGRAFAFLNKAAAKFLSTVPTKRNAAKKAAEFLHNGVAIIFAAEFLSGNAHVFANQLNESAKNFSAYYLISELNHHLMEGFAHPRNDKKNLKVMLFESSLYHPRIQRRFVITRDILKKNSLLSLEYKLRGKNKWEQMLEMLVFGSFASFYLAILNGINPSPVPWVDYFKKRLK